MAKTKITKKGRKTERYRNVKYDQMTLKIKSQPFVFQFQLEFAQEPMGSWFAIKMMSHSLMWLAGINKGDKRPGKPVTSVTQRST